MTNIPEAKLAREAGICYATVALSTDYDCWHETEEDVSVEAIIAIMRQNVAVARRILKSAAMKVPLERPCKCRYAAKDAIITDRQAMDPAARQRLALILGEE